LAASDPEVAKRTWQTAMDAILQSKTGSTLDRWDRAVKDHAFDAIRNLRILETQAEHFLHVLQVGTVATNVFLRRLQNFALDMNWLAWPVIPKRQWPAIEFKPKRAISFAEHADIVEREGNREKKAFYELLWHLGASQGDIAKLAAENIDWRNRTISYQRQKTGQTALLHFGDPVETVLRTLPSAVRFFPICGTCVPLIGQPNSSNVVVASASRASRFIRTVMLGRSGPKPQATRSALPWRPSGTTAWRCTGRMRRTPICNSPRSRSTRRRR
jgi:integrase